MGMNIDDEQLIGYLIKFVTAMPVECDEIRFVDLYGNKKPSQLFDTTTTNTYHYVFTQLTRRNAGKSKQFNRAIVGGGGAWTGNDYSRPVYDKKRSVIGFRKGFRFIEKDEIWYMKEYHLSDKILEDLRLDGKIHYEDFVVCRIRRNVKNFLATSSPISSSQCQETVKSSAAKDELNSILNGNISQDSLLENVTQLPAAIQEECSVPVIHQETPSISFIAKDEECSVPVVHQETPSVKEVECSVPVVHQETPSVSLLAKESNVTAAKEEECSVRPDYDIATYHKELDAYAASILETMVPDIPEQQEDEDEIPLFCEDFYIGHTNLWG